ncbi:MULTISPECIES: cysteine dioxygenase family protein [Nocardia]|uniref:Cysteine dioxygenase n=1 Tax=Nocardia arthritidis TaxID=228602 RepID=A0A6G9Y963_9NOCA|nr:MULTISPECIES: cysteine dioxygenase family protein [Nocardia]QIS09762.1 cysteine dioxygenase [Nocardia arthritidis]
MAAPSTAPSTPRLAELVCAIREVVGLERSPGETARLVAECVEPFLAQRDLLPPGCDEGDPERYRQHLMHAEEDGSFSVVALVWHPGQATPIHDHVAWCVTGVYRGVETERQYEVRGAGPEARLVPVADTVNGTGSTCGFAPPGDIHLVRNGGAEKAISIHVYGGHIGRLGSSVRRVYTLPIADC